MHSIATVVGVETRNRSRRVVVEVVGFGAAVVVVGATVVVVGGNVVLVEVVVAGAAVDGVGAAAVRTALAGVAARCEPTTPIDPAENRQPSATPTGREKRRVTQTHRHPTNRIEGSNR